jgi:uracil-DNA glycosylase family 4
VVTYVASPSTKFLWDAVAPEVPLQTTSKKKPKPQGCEACGMAMNCRSPKMKPFGQGALNIMVVGEAPGRDEDEKGRPFLGSSGKMLRQTFRDLGVDLDKHCITTNCVQCRPANNKFPARNKARLCFPRLMSQIQEHKPNVIFAMGERAIETLLGAPFKITVTRMHGRVIPIKELGAWVVCCFHPAYVLRQGGGRVERNLLAGDLASGLAYIDKPLSPVPFDENKYELVTDMNRAIKVVESFMGKDEVCFDYETTCLMPHHKEAHILSVAMCKPDLKSVCIPFDHNNHWTDAELLALWDVWTAFLVSHTPKVVQTERFEQMWSRKMFGRPINNVVWDTQLATHIIDYRGRTTSLEFMSFVEWGMRYKKEIDRSKLSELSLDDLAKYNCSDSSAQEGIRQLQGERLDKRTKKAHVFFRGCVGVLFDMEENGLKVDLKALDILDQKTKEKLAYNLALIDDCKSLKEYEAINGKLDLDSSQQLGKFLYQHNKIRPPKPSSKAGNFSVDADSIQSILKMKLEPDVSQFLNAYAAWKKNTKLKGTYIDGWRREMGEDHIVHPNFSLATTETYRSSCHDPNAQNIPVRNPLQAQIRKVIVPRHDFFLECDYSGAEVRVIAMYSKDKKLIEEIIGHFDTHRKWAAKLFKMKPADVPKDIRYNGKNGFVFPEFYGSWYRPIAENLGLDEQHVKHVEAEFWNTYSGVAKWKDRLMTHYEEHGFIPTLLGFCYYAPMRKNKIINSPIQGTAFHLFLDGVRKANDEMKRRELKSFLCLEVHDSALADVVDEECEEVVSILETNMTAKRFKWQGEVPLELEWKIGQNLLEMEDIKLDEAEEVKPGTGLEAPAIQHTVSADRTPVASRGGTLHQD